MGIQPQKDKSGTNGARLIKTENAVLIGIRDLQPFDQRRQIRDQPVEIGEPVRSDALRNEGRQVWVRFVLL